MPMSGKNFNIATGIQTKIPKNIACMLTAQRERSRPDIRVLIPLPAKSLASLARPSRGCSIPTAAPSLWESRQDCDNRLSDANLEQEAGVCTHRTEALVRSQDSPSNMCGNRARAAAMNAACFHATAASSSRQSRQYVSQCIPLARRGGSSACAPGLPSLPCSRTIRRHARSISSSDWLAYDKQRYRERHLIENAFCRIKDFRRVHTRYGKLARNFLSAVVIAVIVAFWL